jgi:hypothetical protein
MLQLYAPNRYYVQQWVAYENGAIIVKQLDGQLIRGLPSFNIVKNNDASRLNVSWTQVAMIGINSTLAGTSTAGINIDMVYLDSQIYDNEDNGATPMKVYMNFTTLYGKAWYDYLTSYLSPDNNILPSDFSLTHDTANHVVRLVLNNVSFFNYNKAIMQMTVNLA